MTDQSSNPLDFDRVLERLSEGATTLSRACDFDGAPRPWQVLALAESDSKFAARLQEATVAGAEFVHEQIVNIESGVLNGDFTPAAAVAALNSKRWRLERLDRKRWGAKVEVENTGELALNVTIKRLSPETPEDK